MLSDVHILIMHVHDAHYTHTHVYILTHANTNACLLLPTYTSGQHTCIKQALWANASQQLVTAEGLTPFPWHWCGHSKYVKNGHAVKFPIENSRFSFSAGWTDGMGLDWLLIPRAHRGGERWCLHQFHWDRVPIYRLQPHPQCPYKPTRYLILLTWLV